MGCASCIAVLLLSALIFVVPDQEGAFGPSVIKTGDFAPMSSTS